MNSACLSGVVSMSLFLLACSAGSSGEPGEPGDGGDQDGAPGHQDGGDGSGSGSGSGSDDLQPYRSGTRIKARVLTTPDGAKVLNGWRDTQLNLDCYFSVTADGISRCVPSAPSDQGSYFADAGCTAPVVLSAVYSFNNPKYASQFILDSYPLRYRFYNLGGKVTSYYYKSGTSCTLQTAQPTTEVYLRLAEVPPSTFQSATESLE